MAFTDEIRISISSLFDNSGIKQARRSMDRLNDMSDQTGLGTSELRNRMQGLGLEFNKQGQIMDSTTGHFVSQSQAVQELKTGYGAMAGLANRMNRPMRSIGENLSDTRMRLDSNAQGAAMFQDRYTGAMQNSKQATGEMRRTTAGFRMDLLSVMFAVMALRRVMTGLLRPALKTAGVFETTSSILEILFLPIAIEIQKIMMGILDVVAGMPRELKLLIGAFTVLSIAVLTAALVWSQLALAATSMGYAGVAAMVKSMALSVVSSVGGMATSFMATLSSLATSVGAVMSSIAGFLTAPVIAAIAIVVGAVLLLNEAWANNLFGIRGHFSDFVRSIGKLAPAIGEVLEDSLLAPLNLVIKAVNAMTDKDIDSVSEMFEGAGNAAIDMADKIEKNAQEPGEKGGGFLGFSLTGEGGLLEDGIGSAPDKMMDAVSGIFAPDVKTPSTSKFGKNGNNQSQFIQNNVRQDVNVSRGSGNESDFAFSRQAGRELQKGTENALSKTQGGR